ncbi:MAG: asparaginase [Luteibaculaceae bacterium]
MRPNILLIYTGGTIGMIRQVETGILVPFAFDSLLDNIPELKHIAADIETIAFKEPIDSSNMSPQVWVKIAEIIEQNYNTYDGFVVLHGSDTMAYTASALSFMLNNLSKPVVLTGSQLPIGIIRTDGKENLITAIEIAAQRENNAPIITEVAVYFEYKLYRGNRTYKDNSEHFEAFRSPNYPVLAKAGINIEYNYNYILKPTAEPFFVQKQLSNRVAIIKLFPGISERFIESLLDNAEIDVFIFESFGAGNMPTQDSFIQVLAQAIKRGKYIVNITQCHKGSVNHGLYETSAQLEKIGVISGSDLTAEAAITKAMYLLKNTEGENFASLMKSNLRGELTEK